MTVPVRCTFKSEHECPSEEMGDYTKQAQSVHVRNLVGCGNDAQKSKSATPMDGSSSFTIWTSTWTPWSMSTPSWRCSWWRMTVDALRPFSRPSLSFLFQITTQMDVVGGGGGAKQKQCHYWLLHRASQQWYV